MKVINQIIIVLIFTFYACGNRNPKVIESIPINSEEIVLSNGEDSVQLIPSEIAEKKLIEDKDRIDTIIVYSKTLSPSYSDFWCERINIIYHHDGWKVKVTCSKGAIYSPEHAFAIMEFSNMVTGQTFNVYNDSFTESSLQERQDFICDETITIHLKDNTYKHNSDFGLYIDAPFIFMDIDFCGQKELLVKTWRYFQRNANVYDVYKIKNDGIVALKTPPFNQIDCYTTIDQKNKTIIIFFDGGYSSWKKEFYQLRGKNMELVRVEEFDCNKFTIQKSSRKQEDTPPTIEEIIAFRESDEYKSTFESARLVVNAFIELVNSKKYEEALDLYLSDKGSFNVAFETSTEQYNFFQDNIVPLIVDLKDKKEADSLIIKSMEFHLFGTELVIRLSDWKVIPEHYEHLVYSLGLYLYLTVERYEDAIKLWNTYIEHLNNVAEQPDSFVFGRVHHIKGSIYYKMKDYTAALNSLKEAKRIFEKLDIRESKAYLECVELIDEISKQK